MLVVGGSKQKLSVFGGKGMDMIGEVVVEGDMLRIPVIGRDSGCSIKWCEGEGVDEALGRAHPEGEFFKYSSFKVWSTDMEECDGEIPTNLTEIEAVVYRVVCASSGKQYYMISEGEVNDFEDMMNAVCVPYNTLNLLRFYGEYMCPIGKSRYRIG